MDSLFVNHISEIPYDNKSVKSALQQLNFFSELLEDGYDLRLKVTGRSMSPFLETGSIVTLSRVPVSHLRIGDIIFCRCHDGSFKLHRLIQVTGSKLMIKGDALRVFDPLVDKTGYKGKVIRIERHRADGVTVQKMDIASAHFMNFLIAKYQQARAYLLSNYRRFRTKYAKWIFSVAYF